MLVKVKILFLSVFINTFVIAVLAQSSGFSNFNLTVENNLNPIFHYSANRMVKKFIKNELYSYYFKAHKQYNKEIDTDSFDFKNLIITFKFSNNTSFFISPIFNDGIGVVGINIHKGMSDNELRTTFIHELGHYYFMVLSNQQPGPFQNYYRDYYNVLYSDIVDHVPSPPCLLSPYTELFSDLFVKTFLSDKNKRQERKLKSIFTPDAHHRFDNVKNYLNRFYESDPSSSQKFRLLDAIVSHANIVFVMHKECSSSDRKIDWFEENKRLIEFLASEGF